uniref:Uncharacterized protein n=1 Tax=Knipowitschia caucasica TaxID=637954 RepID=A0AAV2J409_KNICA
MRRKPALCQRRRGAVSERRAAWIHTLPHPPPSSPVLPPSSPVLPHPPPAVAASARLYSHLGLLDLGCDSGDEAEEVLSAECECDLTNDLRSGQRSRSSRIDCRPPGVVRAHIIALIELQTRLQLLSPSLLSLTNTHLFWVVTAAMRDGEPGCYRGDERGGNWLLPRQ